MRRAGVGKMPSENHGILIVDDVKENCDILQHRLAKEGFRIETANTGPAGLEILKNGGIDLVLLDINMPDMDGISVLKAIRSDSALSNVAVVMATADDDLNTAMECLRRGACGYVTKPVSMDQLKQQISHCLDQSKQ
jgi:CheY-like chemotaxis protein